MSGWKALLRADPIDWLLERDNPSMRYFTLTDILQMHEKDTEVVEAKKEIMQTGVVPRILAKQTKRQCN